MSDVTGIHFRDVEGIWWPDYDHKPDRCYHRLTSRITDMDSAVRLCRRRRVAVQAGGMVGMWAIRLSNWFPLVYTFEPEPKLYECMRRNIALSGRGGIVTSYHALGAHSGEALLKAHPSAGSWRIDPSGEHVVPMATIDGIGLQECDAIFLDVEGYEVEVLRGARETIRYHRPVLHVEELDRSRAGIREYMGTLRYVLQRTVHGDAVYAPADRR